VRPFESLSQDRSRHRGWIRHEHVHVVGLAVELKQLGIEVDAHAAHGVRAEGEHGVGEHPAPVLGYEFQLGMQQRHAMSVAG